MQRTAKDQDLVIQEELSRKNSDIHEFVRLFLEADTDRSGTISWEEFEAHMQDEQVKACLKILDVNADEAEQLFFICKPNYSDEIDIHDFVKGCIKMRGGAKAIDIHTLLTMNKAMMEDLNKLHDRLDNTMPRSFRGGFQT